MYLHQSVHDIVAYLEDVMVTVVFLLWAYDWFEDRVKKHLAKKKAAASVVKLEDIRDLTKLVRTPITKAIVEHSGSPDDCPACKLP